MRPYGLLSKCRRRQILLHNLLSSETLRLPRSAVQYIISQYYLPTDRSLLAEEDETEDDPDPEEADQAARREEMQETDEADDEMNEELVGMVL